MELKAAAPVPAAVDPAIVGMVETFLEETISSLAPLPATTAHAGRPRVLPSLCLWAGVLVCLLRGASTQTAVWRLLTQHGLWHYPRLPLSDEAVYRRLARESSVPPGDLTPLARLFAHVTSLLTTRLAPFRDASLAPFASEVLALDETSLDQVGRWLPALRSVPPGDDRLRPGKLACLFDLRRQLFREALHVPAPHQNEKKTAPTLLPVLAPGMLLVFDLGYFSFAWFDMLSAQDFWWVSRLREKTSYSLLHTCYQQGATRDCLVHLGAHRANRAQRPVRLVEFQLGAVHYRYLTNQLDPTVFPLREIARVYLRRWDLECAFQLVKQHLHLRLLWSSKPAVLLQQVWGVLIISQILLAVRLEIARQAGVELFDVSLALLVTELPACLQRGEDPVRLFVRDGRRLGFIRPSARSENRAPFIPVSALVPCPPDLLCERLPRYDQRKCGPRPKAPPQQSPAHAPH
jgi:hypothetical protein